MRASLRYALRFLVIVVVVAVLPALVGQVSPANSPYLSVLQDLSASAELSASPTCPNKACVASTCQHNTGTKCHIKGTLCASPAC